MNLLRVITTAVRLKRHVTACAGCHAGKTATGETVKNLQIYPAPTGWWACAVTFGRVAECKDAKQSGSMPL